MGWSPKTSTSRPAAALAKRTVSGLERLLVRVASTGDVVDLAGDRDAGRAVVVALEEESAVAVEGEDDGVEVELGEEFFGQLGVMVGGAGIIGGDAGGDLGLGAVGGDGRRAAVLGEVDRAGMCRQRSGCRHPYCSPRCRRHRRWRARGRTHP
jgi:hypothetical protein